MSPVRHLFFSNQGHTDILFLSLGVQQVFFGGFYIQKTASTELCPNTEKKGTPAASEKGSYISTTRLWRQKVKIHFEHQFPDWQATVSHPWKTRDHNQVYVNQGNEKLRHKNTALFPAWTRTDTLKRSTYIRAQTWMGSDGLGYRRQHPKIEVRAAESRRRENWLITTGLWTRPTYHFHPSPECLWIIR